MMEQQNPFDILPDELVINIFTTLRNGCSFPSKWILLVVQLSGVCSRWRNLVIGAPLFWNFCVISSYDSLVLAPLFFERSRLLPLDLIVSYFSSEEIFTLLSSVSGRIQSLEFWFISPDELIDCLPIISADSATGLHQLRILCDPKHDWDCNSPEEHFSILRSAETLRSVVLKGVCSQFSPPLVNLTHLEIHEFSPTFAEFSLLFASNSALTALCLPGVPRTEWLNEEYSPIDASSLRSLSVGLAEHWGPRTCGCMLTFLKLDNLEYLEITGNSTVSISNHFCSMNGLSRVHTLRLRNLEMDAPDVPLWSALKAVTRVELYNVTKFPSILVARNGAGDSEIYFPKLTSLLCDDSDIMQDEGLAELVCSRSVMGLSCIELPSFLKAWSHNKVLAKLDAANIKLVFIEENEAAKGLCFYGSESEEVLHLRPEWSDYDEYDEEDFELDFYEW
ncbi:hypothetical protein GGU11DRAFT_819199 [Lentinula aff. detonsa]|uniref:F-box domain-containing protein n=1 Tax=Lentinula detonsa TaxID=2804962 RepID=A0AA38Q5I0_9AGAR|nr:hypothetical protein GGU11DRAFT_819199 [Lentinula aff. detonsa]KAJ3987771.1 hypothetical protein F5890DRAFT_678047 [Lentinula detonsa]